jgi:hypothetical protein
MSHGASLVIDQARLFNCTVVVPATQAGQFVHAYAHVNPDAVPTDSAIALNLTGTGHPLKASGAPALVTR